MSSSIKRLLANGFYLNFRFSRIASRRSLIALVAGALCICPVVTLAENLVFTKPATLTEVTVDIRHKDLVVPDNVEGTLRVVLEGGDGGRVDAVDVSGCVFDNDAIALGGLGARVDATFQIGAGEGKIPKGSTIRFIIGSAGESRKQTSAGDGGGGTGVYLLLPGLDRSDELDWVLLAGAGGGGGGTVECIGLGPLAALNKDDGFNGRNSIDGGGDIKNGGNSGSVYSTYGRGGVDGTGGQSSEEPSGGYCCSSGGGGGVVSEGQGSYPAERASPLPSGSDWGGRGRAASTIEQAGGGGGGYSGGGAGDPGGGGGSYQSTEYGGTQGVVLPRARPANKLSRDGSASYELTGSQTIIISQDTTISGNQSLLEGDTWIIRPGVVFTISHNVRFDVFGTLQNFGTVVNRGTFRNYEKLDNRAGGVIINQTSTPQVFSNSGLLINDGEFYQCFGSNSGAAPVGNAILENTCYMGPDAHGKSECESRIGGYWFDYSDTCRIMEYQLPADKKLVIGPDVTLRVDGTLRIDGALDVKGRLLNYGVVNNCGILTGNPPTPYAALDCVQSPDASFCTDVIGGSWELATKTCRVGDFTLDAQVPLSIGPGFILVVTGTLTNFGILENSGKIEAWVVKNGDSSQFINYGELSLLADGESGFEGSMLITGSFDNYGVLAMGSASLFTESNENIENFYDFGTLTLRCGSTYSGAALEGDISGFVELCKEIFLNSFE